MIEPVSLIGTPGHTPMPKPGSDTSGGNATVLEVHFDDDNRSERTGSENGSSVTDSDLECRSLEIAVSLGNATHNAVTTTNLAKVIAEVKSEKHRAIIEQIRKAYTEGHADAAGRLKRGLPAMMPHGTFSKRSNDALIRHSGVVHLDIDGLGDGVAEYRDHICADPNTLFCFRSPSGRGLKVAYRCDPTRQHLDSFRAAEHYVLMAFGLEVDQACKDVARLCFLSHDPDAFLNEFAQPIPYPKPKVDFHAPAESKPGSHLMAGTTPGDDFDTRGDLPSLLIGCGWKRYGKYGWTRPGKEHGVSATFDKVPGRLYVFSSEAPPFEPNHVYRPWHVYALLNCNGDFRQAAKELAAQGYGTPASKPSSPQVYDPPYEEEAVDQSDSVVAVEAAVAAESKLRALLESRRFNFAVVPAEPVPRFLINSKAVCTPGNLTAIIAQAKTGKTAFIAAMIAAAICAHYGMNNADTLGVTATAPGKLRLLHIDTEQSGYDHDTLIRRALSRTGVNEVPLWLDSRYLTGFSAKDLRQSIRYLMDEANAGGGLHCVILDGVADLVANVNDLAECNELVSELHAAAIRFDCPIICVIHDNEGRDPNGDGRGHLGKQLMRKAESNLRLKKTEEVTVVFSEKMRRAPIFEKDGPRFRWDDAAGMHVTCETLGKAKESAKKEKARDMAVAVFEELGGGTVRWADLLRTIAKVRGVKPSAAEDRFSEMKKLGVIVPAGFGLWQINPVTP